MGLKETLQIVAQTAIQATGTIRTSVIYKQKTDDPSYDPTTGTATESEASYTVNAILNQDVSENGLGGSEDIANNPIDRNQWLAYIAVNDLTPTPQIDDTITIDSIDWMVMDVKTDPADALWIIKIQRQ
jgi:hypothetical protein